jgi:hypothetical protein
MSLALVLGLMKTAWNSFGIDFCGRNVATYLFQINPLLTHGGIS